MTMNVSGSLRAEKVELSAQVKKQQAHILYQEKSLEKHHKQVGWTKNAHMYIVY